MSVIYKLDQNSGWVDKDKNGILTSVEAHDENDVADNAFNIKKELVERGQDLGSLFNASGESLKLQTGQGIWVSYDNARSEPQTINAAPGLNEIDLTINGVNIVGNITTASAIASERNSSLASYIAQLINAESGKTGVETQVVGGNQLVYVNTNKAGTESNMKNIDLKINTGATVGLSSTKIITAFKYTYSATSSPSNPSVRDSNRSFTSTEDLRDAMQTDARLYTDYLGNGWDNAAEGILNKNDGVEVIVNVQGQFELRNPKGDASNSNDGDITDSTVPHTLVEVAGVTGILNQDVYFPVGTAWGTGATAPVAPANTITLPATKDITVPEGTVYNIGGGDLTAPLGGTIIPASSVFTNLVLPATSGVILPTGTSFSNTDELILAGTNTKTIDDHNMFLSVSAYSDAVNDISQNINFTATMSAMQGSLTSGSAIRTSQNIYAASHASSIDVFDSLGSKHTVRLEFSKTGYTADGGTEWSVLISVPEPGDINLGAYPENIITGSISFNSDGSLSTFNPTNLTFTANNGSTPNQSMELKFGSLGKFDGMTSFDNESNTSAINQDGYPGGDLDGIRIDETGTLIGSFTNGRSFGLAQISMAKFTNNGGLESDGGNTFIQTSNSGDPIVGKAATGGRGFVQASALEMSNVDLSRSLTQLIIVQRGFQANSKTITTSDQMLNTLLQLKQ